jgi:pimeloyl-ACP methyl ester carboxylesterase
MKRLLRWTMLVLLAAAVAFVGGSWHLAYRLTGPHPQVVGAPPSDFTYSIEPITFTSSDQETLSGWIVPANKSDKGIVLLHGYTGNRQNMLSRAHFLRDQGFTALLYDARACGESTGDCITFGYRERHDLIAAVNLLKARGCKEIACLGVSQGGATILFAADDLPDLKCVIAKASMTRWGTRSITACAIKPACRAGSARACWCRLPSGASGYPSTMSSRSIMSPSCAARS